VVLLQQHQQEVEAEQSVASSTVSKKTFGMTCSLEKSL